MTSPAMIHEDGKVSDRETGAIVGEVYQNNGEGSSVKAHNSDEYVDTKDSWGALLPDNSRVSFDNHSGTSADKYVLAFVQDGMSSHKTAAFRTRQDAAEWLVEYAKYA